MCSTKEALIILEEAYDLWRKTIALPLDRAYLYGSYARGDYHSASDVDIMMIVDADKSTISKQALALAELNSELSLEHAITVSVMATPTMLFREKAVVHPFFRNIIKEGIVYDGK